MTFFIFLVIFAGVFTLLIRDGAHTKFLLVACAASLIIMFLLKASGKDLIPTLGVGLNIFLMTYDLLALLTMKKPERKSAEEISEPAEQETEQQTDENDYTEDEFQTEIEFVEGDTASANDEISDDEQN